MNSMILYLKDSTFEKSVMNTDNDKNNELFLIDFWAEWCNPCKMITSIVEEIAVKFHERLKVVKLNIDESPIITKKYGVKSIPTLLLIRNRVVLSRKIGVVSKRELEEFINVYI